MAAARGHKAATRVGVELPRVIIAHDYLTQRGGAERVVLAMARAFPEAPIVTSLYQADTTFPEFRDHEVSTSVLQHSELLRRHHRLALPLYAPVFSTMHTDADLVLCSTSGWAHGMPTSGRRLLYVHNTARWLYQVDDYLRNRSPAGRSVARALGTPLRRWDRQHGRSAEMILANSRTVRDRLARYWNVDAEVLYPPLGVDISAEQEPMPNVESGYLLAVSRLVPHKRIDVLVSAMSQLPSYRLVVVGSGPEARTLRESAPSNCLFLEDVSDSRLRWIYANCTALLSAAVEDLGLAALEAMAFGRPAVVLRAGGFLETVLEGETGAFFDRQNAADLASAVRELPSLGFEPRRIAAHAAHFDEASFARKLQGYAARVLA